MTDLEALQANLILDPDDVVTRSVYADCLDDVGEVDRADLVRSRLETSYWKPCECPACGGIGYEDTNDDIHHMSRPMTLVDGRFSNQNDVSARYGAVYSCKRCNGSGQVPGTRGEEWLFGSPEDPANPSEARLLDARAELRKQRALQEESQPHGTLSMSVGGIPFYGTWREVG